MARRPMVASLLLVLAGCASVQRESAVVPGLTLDLAQPQDGDTIVFARSISHAGHDSAAGTRTVVFHIVRPPAGPPLLEVEQRFPSGGGEIVDTAVGELRTLRAVAHRSHQPSRTMRFAFDSTSAHGVVTFLRPAGDSVVDVQQSLGGPIFDSNVIDLVAAALPLRTGFAADIPFFIYERGGRVVMPVGVRERATVDFTKLGRRDVWVVSVGVPGAPATVWVDARTRRVVRVRYDVSARGLSFTDERITPL